MTMPDEHKIGSLVQAYVKARLGNLPDEAEAGSVAAFLDPQLKERVDILGFEGETLLNVSAHEVLSRLGQLESQAAREDARVHKVAVQVRAEEVKKHSEVKKRGKARKGDNVRSFKKAAPPQPHVSTTRSGRQRHR